MLITFHNKMCILDIPELVKGSLTITADIKQT